MGGTTHSGLSPPHKSITLIKNWHRVSIKCPTDLPTHSLMEAFSKLRCHLLRWLWFMSSWPKVNHHNILQKRFKTKKKKQEPTQRTVSILKAKTSSVSCAFLYFSKQLFLEKPPGTAPCTGMRLFYCSIHGSLWLFQASEWDSNIHCGSFSWDRTHWPGFFLGCNMAQSVQHLPYKQETPNLLLRTHINIWMWHGTHTISVTLRYEVEIGRSLEAWGPGSLACERGCGHYGAKFKAMNDLVLNERWKALEDGHPKLFLSPNGCAVHMCTCSGTHRNLCEYTCNLTHTHFDIICLERQFEILWFPWEMVVLSGY